MKRSTVSILIVLLRINLVGCAGYDTKYQSIGKYRSTNDKALSKTIPSDIAVYVQEYPEGFIFNDGAIGVEDNYPGYEVLGEIKIEAHGPNTPLFLLSVFTLVGPVLMMNPGHLEPEEAVAMLQEKASEVGGNAVIGAKTPHEDDDFGYASGIVVKMPEKNLTSTSSQTL